MTRPQAPSGCGFDGCWTIEMDQVPQFQKNQKKRKDWITKFIPKKLQVFE